MPSAVNLLIMKRGLVLNSNAGWLKFAYLTGAVTDAVAVVVLLWPRAAKLMWGLELPSGPGQFYALYATALMFGWTLLLLWAYRKPLERKAIALFTMIVVVGLALAELVAVRSGVMPVGKASATWTIQLGLLLLLSYGYVTANRESAQRSRDVRK